MKCTKRLLIALGATWGLVAPSAHAHTDVEAAATALFDQAQSLIAEEKWSEACPKLAESHELDPQIGTLLHLANCLEKNGQTASAWAAFRTASEMAKKRGDPRESLAQERAAVLEPHLSKLVVRVAVPRRVDGMTIHRDGGAVSPSLWGAALPVDPGTHEVVVQAPNHHPKRFVVNVPRGAGETVLDVPPLESMPDKEPVRPGASESKGDTEAPGDRTFLEARWPALTAGVLGVAGLAVGTVFGLQAVTRKNAADEFCDPDGNCTDQSGVEALQDSLAAGNVSTVAFIAGGVLLGAGTALWFTLPGPSSGAPGDSAGRRGVDSAERGRRPLVVGLVPLGAVVKGVW